MKYQKIPLPKTKAKTKLKAKAKLKPKEYTPHEQMAELTRLVLLGFNGAEDPITRKAARMPIGAPACARSLALLVFEISLLQLSSGCARVSVQRLQCNGVSAPVSVQRCHPPPFYYKQQKKPTSEQM